MNPSRKRILIRVIGAPLLLAALGSILWMDHHFGAKAAYGLRILLTLVGFLGAREFYAMCRMKGIETASVVGALATGAVFFPWPALVSIAGLPGLVGLTQMMRYWLACILLLYLLVKLVVRFGTYTPEGAAMTLLGYLYVGMLWMMFGLEHNGGLLIHYLVFLVATNKGSDMAAYVTGKLIGRRKLAPRVSPNKTWEGAWGGAIGGTALGTAVLLATDLRTADSFAPVPWVILPFYALSVTIAAQLGDLVESAFKRWAGAKDSGRLLPEFGGILDMVDSFLVSIPVATMLRTGLVWLFPLKEMNGT